MAFIEVTEHKTAIRALDGGILGQKERDGSALRIIILLGDIQDLCADHLRDVRQDFHETVRVILLIDIGNILLLLAFSLGIADIVNVKAQCLCQVIEPIKLQLIFHGSSPISPERSKNGK